MATFSERSLSSTALSIEEKAKWLAVIDPLLKYAGSPGDWGYESKLGALINALHEIRREIVREPSSGAES